MCKSKVYDYVVVLKNPNRSLIEKTGWLLSLLAVIILIVNLFITPRSWLLYSCLIIVLIFLVSNYIDKKKKKDIRFRAPLVTAGVGLVMLTDSGLSNITFLVIGLIEKFFIHKTEIGFTSNELVLAKLWKEKISWKELNNVIIRDGMITIDFKNNRLIQATTDDEDDDDYDVDDDEFNAFCQEQLKAANP
jgi:energy-coupling factor transporter transmembrane protein EcfT